MSYIVVGILYSRQVLVLSSGFADQYHLNEVSFNFKEGNLYTILGRTLSGKTTLLKTIAGLLTPDKGDIEFDLESNTYQINIKIIDILHTLCYNIHTFLLKL